MNRSLVSRILPLTESQSPPITEGEFWTSKQRQASSLHEISYRACFKPQLPHYFIERYSTEGDFVYDPFMGRGTTVIEAAMMKRNVIGNDANPLSTILAAPRLDVPELEEVERRLGGIIFAKEKRADIDLSMFFHHDTEAEIVSLQSYLEAKSKDGSEDRLDRWIRMVATNRLTGHSTGFFSVYTLPPNQAALPENQKKINHLRNQKPEYRDTKKIIVKKTRTLIRKVSESDRQNLRSALARALFFSCDARMVRGINDQSVTLTVTSPPFLDIVQYSQDNWLRNWFNRIDPKAASGAITMSKSIDDWSGVMLDVFFELFRITRPGGHVAFEVGEVRRGSLKLEEYVLPLGLNAGFTCEAVLINLQKFTKTANIWGIRNNSSGTNTNRILLFRK
jgi:DNA methylase